MTFIPNTGPFKRMSGNLLVTLSGDRAPFATSGRKLIEPVGFKVVRIDPASRETTDFIRNTKGRPASMLKGGEGLLERPAAVKFAPDGTMYLVDFGRLSVDKDGREKIRPNSGRIFILRALPAPATQPATTAPTTRPAHGGGATDAP